LNNAQTILIVDDDALLRAMLRAHFEVVPFCGTVWRLC